MEYYDKNILNLLNKPKPKTKCNPAILCLIIIIVIIIIIIIFIIFRDNNLQRNIINENTTLDQLKYPELDQLKYPELEKFKYPELEKFKYPELEKLEELHQLDQLQQKQLQQLEQLQQKQLQQKKLQSKQNISKFQEPFKQHSLEKQSLEKNIHQLSEQHQLQLYRSHAYAFKINAQQMAINEISLLQSAIGTGAINPQIIYNIKNNASNLSSSLTTLSNDIQLLDPKSPTFQQLIDTITSEINDVALSIGTISI